MTINVKDFLDKQDGNQMIAEGVSTAKAISKEEVQALLSLLTKLVKAVGLVVVGAGFRAYNNGKELATHPEFDKDSLGEYDGSDIEPGATCTGDSCNL